MDKQRGGSMKVNGYLALVLLALAVAEVAMISHLYRHRTIQVTMPNPYTKTDGKAGDSRTDWGVVHSFPAGRPVCSFADTICYTRI
jgi:hypothetical protein